MLQIFNMSEEFKFLDPRQVNSASRSQLASNAKALGLNPNGLTKTALKEVVSLGLQQMRFDQGIENFAREIARESRQAQYQPVIREPFQVSVSTQEFKTSQLPYHPTLSQNQPSGHFTIEDPTHPFKIGLSKDEGTNTWNAYIESSESYLYDSLDHNSRQVIEDIAESFPVVVGDSIWLTIEFDTWPSVYTAKIEAGDFSATSGEVGHDSGSPPIQTFSRIVLATFESDGDGGVKIKNQFVRNHLQMKMFLVGGLPVNYPVARP